MATIVRHRKTNTHLILVGTGYGSYKSARSGILFGDLAPSEKRGVETMVAVGFPDGRIAWCDSSELQIVSVDGQAPDAILAPFRS